LDFIINIDREEGERESELNEELLPVRLLAAILDARMKLVPFIPLRTAVIRQASHHSSSLGVTWLLKLEQASRWTSSLTPRPRPRPADRLSGRPAVNLPVYRSVHLLICMHHLPPGYGSLVGPLKLLAQQLMAGRPAQLVVPVVIIHPSLRLLSNRLRQLPTGKCIQSM
jgi:hypothetical protein